MTTNTITVLLLALSICSCSHQDHHKPATYYFKVCGQKDQRLLNECVKSSITELKPRLAKGIPALGLPPTEPMLIERLEMSDGQGNFKFSQILTNLTISGLSDYEVKEVSVNLKNISVHLVLFSKQINFEGNYQMDGKIMIIPVKGNGRVVYNFTDVTTTYDSIMEKYKRNGVDFVRVKKSSLRIDPTDARAHFTNLFNGDKMLGTATNKLLNDNWREAFETFRHLPESAFAKLLSSIASNIYKTFPLKELFPFSG